MRRQLRWRLHACHLRAPLLKLSARVENGRGLSSRQALKGSSSSRACGSLGWSSSPRSSGKSSSSPKPLKRAARREPRGARVLPFSRTASVRLSPVSAAVSLTNFSALSFLMGIVMDTLWGQMDPVQAQVFSQRVLMDSRRAPGERVPGLPAPVQIQLDSVQGQLFSERAPVNTVRAPLNSVRALMDSVQAPMDSRRAPLDTVQALLETKRIQWGAD
jgi:hypothetical protein